MEIYSPNSTFDHMVEMLRFNYGKNPAFSNVLFILGYNVIDNITEFVKKYPGMRVIIYQLEQLHAESPWNTSHIIQKLTVADEIWDYDTQNIQTLRAQWRLNAQHKPLLYTPTLKTMVPASPEVCDIDGLFYGYMTPRRGSVIQSLCSSGYGQKKFVFVNQIWKEELDSYISRSKIVFNIHVLDTSRQEQVRMFYPVINGRCVLSEVSPINYLGNSIVECNLNNMVSLFNNLIASGDWLDIARNAESEFISATSSK